MSVEEPQPGAESDSALSFSCTSASAAPYPQAPQEQYSCVICLSVPSTQHTGSRRWAVAGFCGTEWKLPSLTQCSHIIAVHGFAHIHIPAAHPSVCLMHILTATWTHMPVGVTKAQVTYIQRKEIKRAPALTDFTDTHLGLGQDNSIQSSPSLSFCSPVHTAGLRLRDCVLCIHLGGRPQTM